MLGTIESPLQILEDASALAVDLESAKEVIAKVQAPVWERGKISNSELLAIFDGRDRRNGIARAPLLPTVAQASHPNV